MPKTTTTGLRIRQIGLNAQELETGPFLFLLSHSIPVAYRDTRPNAMRPGLFRTDKFFSKSTARHINKWLNGKGPFSVIPHDVLVETFRGLSRYAGEEVLSG
jgi:hypothetical protein